MEDLVRWLNTQLDEEQQEAEEALRRTTTTRRRIGGQWVEDTVQPPEWRRSVWDPARVLREINAKRSVVELHKPIPDPTPPFRDVDGFLCSVCTAGGAMYDQQRGVLFTDLTVFPCATLRLLAAVYADRPGYQESWRPS